MGEQEEPDDRLVSLSKDGSLAAFNSLVERYQSPVFNLCYRLLGNREAAEDAAQETFLSAFRAIARFAGEGNVRAWLLRIAANQSKDELRRRKRKDVAGSLDQIFDTMEAPVEVPDHSPGAEELVERIEFSAALQDALMGLPFEQRQAVLLIDYYDFSYEDVAKMTGASLGTVKSRVFRGRDRLRQIVTRRPELLGAIQRHNR
jgi:RNA polymerase sigma-70 factor (ECF subfamily)